MPDKEEIIAKARKFLEAVLEDVPAQMASKVIQQGMWWSAAKPGDSKVVVQSSGTSSMSKYDSHEREVFNTAAVGVHYQTHLMHSEFPEQSELSTLIIAADIQAMWVPFGFLLPLVYKWCNLPDPLDPNHSAAQELLDAFADAVLEHKSTTTYRDALVRIDLGGEQTVLEEGIVLRPITEDELYDLSREKHPTEGYQIQFFPSDTWSILDIQIKHPTEDSPKVYEIREAVIAALALVGVGNFALLPIGMETNFGRNATGRGISGSQLPREFGLPMATTSLSADTRQKLADKWPRFKEIMIPGNHYLALPLRRLADGLSRSRLDDKIIDYAIGLETLLSEGNERTEISYKFSLWGAIILGDSEEDKIQAAEDFKALYNARSGIAHGRSISLADLKKNSDNGERLLRIVWEWHLTQGLTRTGALSRIKRLVLGGVVKIA